MKRPVVLATSAALSLLLALTSLLGVGLLAAPRAAAAPLSSAAYGGSAGGSVTDVDLALIGLNLAGVALTNSEASVSSSANPRSSAQSANLDAAVLGLGLGVLTSGQTAPPDHGSPNTTGISASTVLGIGAGVLSTSNQARWAGDAACQGGLISDSRTETAGLSVSPSLLDVLTTGVAHTRGTTALVANAGANTLNKGLQSTASGSVANVSVLGGGLTVRLSGDATLTATATGAANGTYSYTPPDISYRVGPTGAFVPLAAGGSVRVQVGPLASVILTANNPTMQSTTSGTARTATARVAALSLDINAGLGVGTASVDVLPLTATATVPSGGIDCPPGAPTLNLPADGSRTNNPRPVFSGAGTPGATVNLTIDGTERPAVATVAADGSWTYTPTAALPEGSRTVSVTQTLNGATSARSATNTFTIDATAPSTPTLAAPADGSVSGTARPTFTGTAEAGSTVSVFVDGASIGTTTTATAGGTFSLLAPGAIADGSHPAYVTATDEVGNASPRSNTNTFRIDATAPAAPRTTTPADGSSTRETTPTLAGTAEAGSTVRVFVDDAAVGTTTADGSGGWQLTSPALAEGSHAVDVTATDAAGNVSVRSNTNTFRVDRSSPAVPVINTPADGSRTDDTTPTVSGTGEAGARLTVTVDGTAVGTVTVAPDRTWTLTPTTALAEGAHVAAATQTDAAGNTSDTAANRFVVDVTAPAAPVITGPAQNATLSGPDVNFSGTGEPGASLTVRLDSGQTAGPVTVTGAGTWSAIVTGLTDATYLATATQTDPAGNGSVPSDGRTFRIRAAAPAAPVISTPANGAVTANSEVTVSGTGVAGATVTVTGPTGTTFPPLAVLPDGSWSLTQNLPDGTYGLSATQDEGAGASASSATVTFRVDTAAPDRPVITNPADGSVGNDRTPTVTGTGEPGAALAASIDGTPVGTVDVDGSGAWALMLTAAMPGVPLAADAHTVSAVQTDAAGNPSPAASNTFRIDVTAPGAPTITTPADGAVTGEATPDISGRGEAGARLTVRLDGTVLGTVTVAGDGRWTVPVTAALDDGSHQVSASQVDAAGNRSGATDTTFLVDTEDPAVPTVTRPADGSMINIATSDLVGAADPGVEVEVFVDGDPVGTTTADGAGAWSLRSDALDAGDHTVAARAVDPAGNTSARSAANTFTVDATAPADPVIITPADDALVATTRPTVRGTGEAGDQLTLSIDGAVVGTVTVAAGGGWSVPVSTALSDGRHAVTAVQVDAAGNVSGTARSTFRVDATAPAAPVILAPTQNALLPGPDVTVTGTGEPGARLVLTTWPGSSAGVAGGTTSGPVTVRTDGGWDVTLAAVGDGTFTSRAVQSDTAGNESAGSNARTFRVSADAPAAPVISGPVAGAVLDDATPTISGTGNPGSELTVSVDGDALDPVTVGDDGRWSIDVTPALADGAHAATAATAVQVVDGRTSAEAGTTFTVDTTAPAAPVIQVPADGSVLADPTPTISGTGEGGSPVLVSLVDSVGTTQVVGTVTAGPDGRWSITVADGDALADGRYTATAVQTDAAGNASPAGQNVFTVDTAGPAAPVVTAPANGASTGDTSPMLAGTAEPRADVAVSVDGTLVGPVTATAGGTWELPSPTLAAGAHTVSAVASDAAGNVSVRSNTNTFTVDTTAPERPVITAPANGSTMATARPTITGTGETGAQLVVSVDGTAVGTVTVTGGTWTLPLTTDLADGGHTAAATQTDPAGNVSNATTTTFTIDTSAPAVPQLDAPTEGAVVPGPTATVVGRGEPGSTLVLTADGTPLAPVTVDRAGGWTVSLSGLEAGSTPRLTAMQTDPAGNASGSTGVRTFTVVPAAPDAPVITDPTTDEFVGATPTIRGTGVDGATVTVTVDGAVVGTGVVADGTWSVPVGAGDALDQGRHTATAVQTVAGEGSAESTPVSFLVDTAAPAAPVIDVPVDGAVLSTRTPAITGTGEPGAVVSVFLDSPTDAAVDGQPVGTVAVAGNGTWTVPATAALADGPHSAAAVQTDVAGQVSADSNTTRFTVDTRVAAPVISVPVDGSCRTRPRGAVRPPPARGRP